VATPHDAGPWVTLLCRNESLHHWAIEQFWPLQPPLLSCEAVVSETHASLKRSGFAPALALGLNEREVVELQFDLQQQIGLISSLFKRYENVPASLADAALIRLAEIDDFTSLLTTVSDFHIYNDHGRQTIPLIT
jgi:hypothetical protein